MAEHSNLQPPAPPSQTSQQLLTSDPLQPGATGGNNLEAFSLTRFIPLLAERIYTLNPLTRSFLISWISVLDSIPELELITSLPEFLDGLLGFVNDANAEVRLAAKNILGEFLREIKEIVEDDGVSRDLSRNSTPSPINSVHCLSQAIPTASVDESAISASTSATSGGLAAASSAPSQLDLTGVSTALEEPKDSTQDPIPKDFEGPRLHHVTVTTRDSVEDGTMAGRKIKIHWQKLIHILISRLMPNLKIAILSPTSISIASLSSSGGGGGKTNFTASSPLTQNPITLSPAPLPIQEFPQTTLPPTSSDASNPVNSQSPLSAALSATTSQPTIPTTPKSPPLSLSPSAQFTAGEGYQALGLLTFPINAANL